MKKDEISKQPWFQAIKGANRDLISDVGGIDRAARVLGVSTALVGNWNNWNLPDLMPLPEILILEGDLGKSVVSRAMAVLAGATVVDAVDVACKRNVSLAVETAGMMTELSEYLASHAVASADNRYSVAELRELLPKAEDLRSQVSNVVATIYRKLALAVGGAE